MPDSILETTAIRVVLDDSGLRQSLQNTVNRIRQSAAQTKTAADQMVAPWKLVRAEIFNLRDAYETGAISQANFIKQMEQLRSVALSAREGIQLDARATREGAQAWDTYTKAAGSASRYLATAEGRVSKLGLSANVANASVMTLSQGLYRMGPAGMALGMSVQGAGDALAAMGPAAVGAAAGVAGLGIAAAALTAKGIPQVKEFQAAMQLLAATGNKFTNAGLTTALDGAAVAAGKAGTQFSRAELATGLARLVKAGLSASDAMKLLPSSMQLAVESSQSFEQASTLLLTNLREFGFGADKAAATAGALGIASLRARDNAQALSEGLATVGPIAQQAGLSLDQTLGALVTLSNKGLNAADIGARGLRTTITHLINPSKQAAKALADMGVSVKDAAGHQRSFDAILGDVIRAANKYGISIDKATGKVVGQHDAIALLAQIVGQRGLAAVAGMAAAASDATNSWDANTKAIQAGADHLKEYANTLLTSNLGAAQTALKTSLDNLAQSFVLTFTPAIISALGHLTDFINTLDNLANHESGLQRTAGIIAQFSAGNVSGNVKFLQDQTAPKPGQPGYEAWVLAHMGASHSHINTGGGVGTQLYGPPIAGGSMGASGSWSLTPSAGSGGTTSTPAGVLAYATPELIAQARTLVARVQAAQKGSDVRALLKAEEGLNKFEAVGGASEQALRKSIVSAVTTVIGNSTKAAAKSLKSDPAALQVGIDAYGMAQAALLHATLQKINQEQASVNQANAQAASWAALHRIQGSMAAPTIPIPAHRAVLNNFSAYLASGTASFGNVMAGLNEQGRLFAVAESQAALGQRSLAAAKAVLASVVRGALAGVEAFRRGGQNYAVLAQASQQTALAASDAMHAATDWQTSANFAPYRAANAQRVAQQRSAEIAKQLQAGNYLSSPGATPEVVAAERRVGDWLKAALNLVLQGAAQEAMTKRIGAGVTYTGIGAYADNLSALAAQGRTAAVAQANTAVGVAYANSGTGQFQNDLNQLAQAGRAVAVSQRKAADDAAKVQVAAGVKFAQLAEQGGSEFVSTVKAFQSGNVGGGIAGLGSLASGIASAIPGGQLAGAIIGAATSIFGGLLSIGASPAARPAPHGGAFGATRPTIGNPDIALTVGTSQASLGPAISSKILDAGNLFDKGASQFWDAVQEAKALVKSAKPSYAVSNSL